MHIQLTLAEKRERGLKEIFYFYAKQQFFIGKKPTFQQIESTVNTMYLGSFMRFCKDFQFPLPVSILRGIFKKKADLSRDMRYEGFLVYIYIYI